MGIGNARGYLSSMRMLIQCRPGFEDDAVAEVRQRVLDMGGSAEPDFKRDSGFAILEVKGKKAMVDTFHWKEWVFVRQWWSIEASAPLGGKDRLTALLEAARCVHPPGPFSEIFLEVPDTNEGREHTGFAQRIKPLLEKELTENRLLDPSLDSPRLVIFLADAETAYVGSATERSAPWPMGFPRLRFPSEAPSRSTLKLAEAFEVFLSERERDMYLCPGMRAVDLGAAPGGWTWQLCSRGLRVEAVDNGPLKGAVLGHPLVKHFKADGFRYRPKSSVDWMVCDMVEQPRRVAELIVDWLRRDLARHFIFNLKLPGNNHLEEVRACLALIEDTCRADGIGTRLLARQLYHDREEITCYLRREGKARPKSAW